MLFSITALSALVLAAEPRPRGQPGFRIQVVDDQTGRGVPLVELATVNQIRSYTDSNGFGRVLPNQA